VRYGYSGNLEGIGERTTPPAGHGTGYNYLSWRHKREEEIMNTGDRGRRRRIAAFLMPGMASMRGPEGKFL